GTTFTIYLPASFSDLEIDENDAESKNGIDNARIMIMDDDKSIQQIASKMLSRLSHEVVVAHDGEEAIRLYNKYLELGEPLDLVIMDLTIPGGMGGKKAIVELQKINPEVKAIVSSGYSNDPVMANYQQYGFKAAISKPFMVMELSKVIYEVLGDSFNA
ncbi:MAG: response regulator, partial [bacterium]